MQIPNLFELTEYYNSAEEDYHFLNLFWPVETRAKILRETCEFNNLSGEDDFASILDYLHSRGFEAEVDLDGDLHIVPKSTVDISQLAG